MDTDNFLLKKFFYIFTDIDNIFNSIEWIRFTKSAIISNTDLFDKTKDERLKYGKYVNKILGLHPEWQEYYNNNEYLKPKHIRSISPFNIAVFNELITSLNYKFNVNVIFTSSEWRDGFDIKTIPALVKNGFNYRLVTLDKTTKGNSKNEEIINYMNEIKVINPKSNNYIILDSNCDDLRSFPKSNLFTVDKESGINKELVSKIISNYNK